MTIKVNFRERRGRDRQKSYKLLPLSLVNDADHSFIPAQLGDVSSNGIGIVTAVPLEQGKSVTLQMLRMDLGFEIAWCREEEETGEYTCGLVLKDQSMDLEEMFRGLLRETIAS